MPKLDAIGIVVSDLARAISFYESLGLDFGEVDVGEPHAEASAPGGLRLMLDTEESVKGFSSWSAPSGGSHRAALAFLCEHVAQIDEVFRRLVALGGHPHLEPFDAPWGQRYATVLDPDGNGVDLFAYL